MNVALSFQSLFMTLALGREGVMGTGGCTNSLSPHWSQDPRSQESQSLQIRFRVRRICVLFLRRAGSFFSVTVQEMGWKVTKEDSGSGCLEVLITRHLLGPPHF